MVRQDLPAAALKVAVGVADDCCLKPWVIFGEPIDPIIHAHGDRDCLERRGDAYGRCLIDWQ
jgi:hypothetical protein